MNIHEYFIKELEDYKNYLPPGKTVEDAAQLFIYGARKSGWNHKTAGLFTDKFPFKIKGCNKHYIWFLESKKLKLCTKCNEVHPLFMFSSNLSNKDNKQSYCKSCTSIYMKRYPLRGVEQRIKQKQALPKWANIYEIEQFYANCPKGYHVDHIIPLAGKDVCGLHVLNNLQYLPAKDNLQKSNKFVVG